MYSVKVLIRTRDTHVMAEKKGEDVCYMVSSAIEEDRAVWEDQGRRLESTKLFTSKYLEYQRILTYSSR